MCVSLYGQGMFEHGLEGFKGLDKDYKDVAKYVNNYDKYIDNYNKKKFYGHWYKMDYSANGLLIEESSIKSQGYTLSNELFEGEEVDYTYYDSELIENTSNIGESEYYCKYKLTDNDTLEFYMVNAKNNQQLGASTIYKRGEIKKRQKPFIGMTRSELTISTWSRPEKINKTTTGSGTSEQWCYKGYKYVYVDNNVVTAIQE